MAATLNQQLAQTLSGEFSLTLHHVSNALELWLDGATIPFIARYRKERTGEMTEVVLRELFERYGYLSELEERKTAILESIAAQGKLTEDLEKKIRACQQKTDLEDLYLPYRPKRRTRATIARERGLEPLAEAIAAHNHPQAPRFDLDGESAKFVNPEQEVGGGGGAGAAGGGGGGVWGGGAPPGGGGSGGVASNAVGTGEF